MMFGERHRSYSTEMIEHIPKCFQFPYCITTWQKSLHTYKNFAQLIIKCSHKIIPLSCFRTFSQFHLFFNIIVQFSETLRRILTLFWLARREPFFERPKTLQQRLRNEIVMQKNLCNWKRTINLKSFTFPQGTKMHKATIHHSGKTERRHLVDWMAGTFQWPFSAIQSPFPSQFWSF